MHAVVLVTSQAGAVSHAIRASKVVRSLSLEERGADLVSSAFTQIETGWAHVDAAAQVARRLVQQIERERMLDGGAFLLNVNVPNRPFDELKPMKVCRLGRRHAAEKVITQESPRGETMYWIAGAGGAKDSGEGTDFHATAAGHIALTPLQIDLTDHANLGQWRETVARLGN